MPLVVDQLQLWTVGFKWAGLDPNRVWLRIPTHVRDNFSTLMEAILSDHLACLSLSSEKYAGDDPAIAKFHIRYWLDNVYECIHGSNYNRKLLKWAIIERSAFQEWCERRTIPLPEFWFPHGWTEYRLPEYDRPSSEPIPAIDTTALAPDGPGLAERAEESAVPSLSAELPPKELRDNQIARIASQQVARMIWKEEPDKTIAAVCKDERVLKYGGAQYYAEEVVRRWIKAVAAPEVSAKRGRPKKKNPTEDG
jgi:hypothetical protein